MGAVRMRVQTADKNITIIHTTPVHQLTSGENKSCVFVQNKYIKFNCELLPKYESIIHNNASSSEEVILSESGEKSAQIKHRLVYNSSKQICEWILMWETNRRWTFALEEALSWIMARSNGLKLKTRHQLMGWSGVDYLCIIVMLLSAVWTFLLTAPIHCRASIAEQVMQCYISPNLMKKQTLKVNIFRKCKFWAELLL